MTANPSKFQAITIGNKDKNIDYFKINSEFKLKVDSNVTLLGVQIDEHLKFDSHIDKICKKAANQLNFLKRLAKHMGDREKRIIVNSFILCHFNYCPLIWMLCGKGCQDKLEKINERALPLAQSDYSSSYANQLAKSKETTIHIQSIRLLALEVYKTLNNINPIFMKDYFLSKAINRKLRIKNPLEIPKVRTTNYGIRSLSFQGPKIWNSLPDEIKTAQNTKQFKNSIKTWFLSNKCACSFCNK